MPCYDIEGATVDCNDPTTIASGEIGYSPPDAASTSPIAAQASASSGPSALSGVFTSLLNFGAAVTPTIAKAVSGTGTTTGLRLQINPATGQQQYFNPATGQYVGGAVNTGGLSGLLSGNSGFLLIIAALVAAFFFFGGRKRLAAA